MRAALKIKTLNRYKFLHVDNKTMAIVNVPVSDFAFEQIFKNHFKALHSYAFTILKETDTAEEIVQNIFFKLWEKKDSLNIDSSIKAYLYKAVHNESLNALKHEKVKMAHQTHTAYQMKNETDNAAKKLMITELEGRLRHALNKLPEQCRTIFQLSRFEELKYKEIADHLNLSVKTIENQMGKALKILRLDLAEFLPFLLMVVLKNANAVINYPNKNLDLSKAQHYVLSYNHVISNNLKIKSEVYYQQLFNIPVSADVNKTFSTLNVEGDFILDPLVNKGKGKNYGIEISLEKNLSKNYYFMFSNSFYQSKYAALDGVERNTKYNGNYISNFVGGKDFIFANQRKTFGINLRMLYTGGYRTTPINFTQSQIDGVTVFKEKDAYSLQNPYYFRTDLRLSMKWNRKHTTSTLSLDVQNLTNRKNLFNETYDAQTNKITKNYQLGLLPILNYKIEF